MRMSRSNVMGLVAVLLGAGGIALRHFVPGAPRSVSYVLIATALMMLMMALAWWGRVDDGCNEATPHLRRRYVRELLLSMAAYMVMLGVSVVVLRLVEPLPLRIALALAPVLPIGFALRAMVRYVRDIDEMQQRIELEAISIATIFVSMLYMTGGFLQSAELIDIPGAVAMIWVFPAICFSYGVAKAIVARRYH